MTAWPPGEGMMNAGIGLFRPPAGGFLLGRPRPRFTGEIRVVYLINFRTKMAKKTYLLPSFIDVNNKTPKTLYKSLPGNPKLARKFCTWLAVVGARFGFFGGRPLSSFDASNRKGAWLWNIGVCFYLVCGFLCVILNTFNGSSLIVYRNFFETLSDVVYDIKITLLICYFLSKL